MTGGPVALVRCENYEQAAVDAAVERAISLIGGIERYVRPGQRVLVKPNLLRGSDPSEGIVTHPSVVRAVASLARDAGGRVVIGDSPGGAFSPSALRRVYAKSGMEIQ